MHLDAQGRCAFGYAGLLCIWIRRAAEHVEVPCGYFLMTALFQYAAASKIGGAWVPGKMRLATHQHPEGAALSFSCGKGAPEHSCRGSLREPIPPQKNLDGIHFNRVNRYSIKASKIGGARVRIKLRLETKSH